MKRLKSTINHSIKGQPIFLAVFFIFAYLSTYYLSGTNYPASDADASWYAVLEHAARLKFQFGRDIVFTYGPFEYLYAVYSQGHFIGLRIIFALFWALIIAYIATSIVRRTTGWIRVLFIAWFLIFFRYAWIDGQGILVVTYGSLVLMSEIKERKTLAALFIIMFALLSLMKFTFFLSVVIGIVVSSLVQLVRKRYHAAWIIPVSFSSLFFTLWLATGQELALLWPWIKGSMEISNGYTEAMTFPPDPSVLWLCVSAAVLFLIALIINVRQSKITFDRAASLTLILLYTFLSWKHGFVRADLHVFTFICFLPVAFILMFMERDAVSFSFGTRAITTMLYGGVILLTVLAGNIQKEKLVKENLMEPAVMGFPKQLLDNAELIVKSATGDWQYCYASVRKSSSAPRNPDLPVARSVIGEATVDVISYRQWAALANNLNYHPRPVFQSYSAYTPYLQDLNLEFFKSERRPQFLLFNLESIDSRYPMLDDATVLPFIFKNYRLVAQDGMFLVLQENGGAAANVNLRLVHERSIAFDEILDLSNWNNGPLIIQTIARPSFFGRLYAFFYEAPVLSMTIYADEGRINTRFIPPMAERGFMINPLLLQNTDVVNFYKNTGVRVRGISFSRGGSSELFTPDKITIKVFSLS